LRVFARCWRAMSRPEGDAYATDLARTGVLVITLFLIDGIKIEQTRLALSDYWHFWFGLLGVLWAFSGRLTADPKLTPQSAVHSAGILAGN